jgi:hypothetical protein
MTIRVRSVYRGSGNNSAKARFTDLSQIRTGAKRFAANDFPYTNDSVRALCNIIMTPERHSQSFCDNKIWKRRMLSPQPVASHF